MWREIRPAVCSSDKRETLLPPLVLARLEETLTALEDVLPFFRCRLSGRRRSDLELEQRKVRRWVVLNTEGNVSAHA